MQQMPCTRRIMLRLALLLACALSSLALDNGLGGKPAMGFNT
jgi:hypothetical protein